VTNKSTTVKKKAPALPKKVNMGCYEYEVSECSDEDMKKKIDVETEAEVVWGAINDSAQEIYINKEATPQMKRLTLLHEIVHAITFNNDIGSITKSEDMEDTVDRLASGIYEIMKRNPEVVKWVMEG
jgi:Zn-dependent peptidase ImmA (M78 family)